MLINVLNSNIPELYSLTSYNSRIILIKIETYYSQNYAGTLGSSLLAVAIIHAWSDLLAI